MEPWSLWECPPLLRIDGVARNLASRRYRRLRRKVEGSERHGDLRQMAWWPTEVALGAIRAIRAFFM